VVRLEGGQVRLGIDAPRDVVVVRAELVPNHPGLRARGGSRTQPDQHRQDVRYSPSDSRGTGSPRRGRFR
jgi:hypothetical protein